VVGLAEHPNKEEEDEDSGAGNTTTLGSEIREVCSEEEGTGSHSEAREERDGNPVTVRAKETALFELGRQVLRGLPCYLLLLRVITSRCLASLRWTGLFIVMLSLLNNMGCAVDVSGVLSLTH